MDCNAQAPLSMGIISGKNTGVDCNALLQGTFPTQRIEPRSSALQADSLPSEPPGKPKSTGVSSLALLQMNLPDPGITGISWIAGWIFTIWATNEGPFASEKSKLVYLHSNPSISTLSSTRGRYYLHVQEILKYRWAIPKLDFRLLFFFFILVNLVIHWNETVMGLHVFPIPIPPPTSLSTRSP